MTIVSKIPRALRIAGASATLWAGGFIGGEVVGNLSEQTRAPMALEKTENPQRSKAKVGVAAYIDATDPNLYPYQVQAVDALEKAYSKNGSSFVAAVDFREGGNHVFPVVLFSFGEIAVLAAVGFYPRCSKQKKMLEVLALMVGMSGYFTGTGMSEMNRWQGHRHYQICSDRTARIDSPVIFEDPTNSPPSSEALAKFLSDHRVAQGTNIFLVDGHGGDHSAAHLSFDLIADALREAEEKTGRKVDVVIFRSCCVGTLSNLEKLHGYARVALVSEEMISMRDPWPLTDMMIDAVSKGGTAEEMAKRFIELIHEKGSPRTFSAINLDRIPVLNQARIKLRDALSADTPADSEKAKQIREAIQSATCFVKSNTYDFGEVLTELHKLNLSPQIQSLIEETQKCLKDAVIASTFQGRYKGCSGISIHQDSIVIFQ